MAEKRMMTRKITDDNHFLALSSPAQALYLHLSMAADDDGFCNQVEVCMFRAHASVSDLESLLTQRYIYQFKNGVIVIKHWRMANALRKDRYTPTVFQEEFKKLGIKSNGSYTLKNDLVATWLPDGCQMVATDKNSIDKNNKDIHIVEQKPHDDVSESIKNIISYLNRVCGSNYKANSKESQKHIRARLKDGFLEEEFFAVIDKKYAEWHGTDMEKFLRPQTLFGTKFESYLNQKINKPKKAGKFNDFKQNDYNFSDLESELLSN